MNKKQLLSAFFLLLLVVSAGCTRRFVTAQAWQENAGQTLYTAYLEDKCLGTWCTQFTSKVKACVLNKDNSLTCKDLAEAEKALNPKTFE